MEFRYIGFSFDSFVSKSISSNFIKLFLFRFSSNSRNLIDTRLKFLVPLSIVFASFDLTERLKVAVTGYPMSGLYAIVNRHEHETVYNFQEMTLI